MLKKQDPARPFFRTVHAYVLLFRDRDSDWCIDAAQTELGRAVTCFLSPFDAVIEAAHLARNGSLIRSWPLPMWRKTYFAIVMKRDW
jgi:hypothetical protein